MLHGLYISHLLTTIIMQLSSIGIENTTDINRPLLSKYCCLEKRAQFLAATSFILSEKYTSNTVIYEENKMLTWVILTRQKIKKILFFWSNIYIHVRKEMWILNFI